MRELLAAALDLVLPVACPGCGDTGAALCASCAAAVSPRPRVVVPRPTPPGWPPCWAGGAYEGGAAALVRVYKDGDRRDLAPVLALPLARALDAVLRADPLTARAAARGGLLLVPAPSAPGTARARGDRPVHALARRAVAGLRPEEARVVDLLRLRRGVRDQATLGGAGRRANLAGAMHVSPCGTGLLAGATCVLVDDVVTSGSTLAEATRVLRRAGAARVVAACAFATPLRSDREGPALASAPVGV
ncbi:hypothetical protein AWH69_07085 [Janibacter melonis]|uniref:Phosphoribosyltransferase domain-containing protein n=1 Tax=Janibacter melonis TaxID=262209 RepID=A0A176QDP0_9MICO|nr:phosphoribosyltransferase family protein [Janibacter melonis]OAB87796.1 hypothetical protein AWH69_07085 [Janibacter melonis]